MTRGVEPVRPRTGDAWGMARSSNEEAVSQPRAAGKERNESWMHASGHAAARGVRRRARAAAGRWPPRRPCAAQGSTKRPDSYE